MSVQFIENNGHKQYAIVPIDIYNNLLEKAEWLEDVDAYEKAKHDDDELVPSDVVKRLLSGENKIKVWREYRTLSQAELAKLSGIELTSIAQMEGGKRTGSVLVFKKIAEALQLDLDDLV
jgi:DNA-binding XRE family transcriptional regulator